jgi:hypothetical protein
MSKKKVTAKLKLCNRKSCLVHKTNKYYKLHYGQVIVMGETENKPVKFQVLTAANIKMTVFRDVAPYSLVKSTESP